MNNIILKDCNGADIIYKDIDSLRFRTEEGGFARFGEPTELNIAYGDIPPEDMSKLWIKTNNIDDIHISSLIDLQVAKKLSARLPVATYNLASAAVGDKIYLFGGHDNDVSKSIHVFNTKTNTLTTPSSSLQTIIKYTSSAVVGTKIYLFGSSDESSSRSIFCFDTETSTLEKLDINLPSRLYGAGVASFGTNVYLFGGVSSGFSTKTIYMFDTEAETISTLSVKLPQALMNIGSSVMVIGSTAYIFGGNNNDNASGFKTIILFDQETHTVSTSSAVLANYAYGVSCAAAGTKIYLFGGVTSYTNVIYCFDSETSTITSLSRKFPITPSHSTAVTVGTKIYIFGGRYSSSSFYDTIYAFDALVELPNNHVGIMTNKSDNTFELTNSVTIDIDRVYKGNSEGVGEPVEAYLYKNGEWTLI